MKSVAIKLVLGTIVVGGAALASLQAQAMPAPRASMLAGPTAGAVEQAGWVCGPYGCAWRPVYGYGRPWGYGGYGYRPHRPWGGGWGYGGGGWGRGGWGHGGWGHGGWGHGGWGHGGWGHGHGWRHW